MRFNTEAGSETISETKVKKKHLDKQAKQNNSDTQFPISFHARGRVEGVVLGRGQMWGWVSLHETTLSPD